MFASWNFSDPSTQRVLARPSPFFLRTPLVSRRSLLSSTLHDPFPLKHTILVIMKFSTIATVVCAAAASVIAAPTVQKRGVDPSLVPDFGVQAGANPTGTGCAPNYSILSSGLH